MIPEVVTSRRGCKREVTFSGLLGLPGRVAARARHGRLIVTRPGIESDSGIGSVLTNTKVSAILSSDGSGRRASGFIRSWRLQVAAFNSPWWKSRAVPGGIIVVASLVAVLMAGGELASPVAQAQQTGSKRTDLQRHDLSAPGREVIQVRVDFASGVRLSQAHPSGRRDHLRHRRHRSSTRSTASRR